MASKIKTSPAGITGWTCINKPSVKFKAEGEYSIEVIYPAQIAGPLKAEFQQASEAAQAKMLADEKDAKKLALLRKYSLFVPGTAVLDDAGNETGDLSFKFKATALVKPKDKSKEPFEKKIGVFDAKGVVIPSDVIVARGSTVKVAYEVCPFKNDATKQIGVSLRLQAVQVLKLVAFGGTGDASSYGFGAEEGYTHEASEPSNESFQAPADATDATPAQANGDF